MEHVPDELHRLGLRLRANLRLLDSPIFAFFIVNVNDKGVVHVGVTRNPSAEWRTQQLCEATPFGKGPELFIRDRDSKFGPSFDRVAQGASIRFIITPVKTPNMNAVCERFSGSARRECLATCWYSAKST